MTVYGVTATLHADERLAFTAAPRAHVNYFAFKSSITASFFLPLLGASDQEAATGQCFCRGLNDV